MKKTRQISFEWIFAAAAGVGLAAASCAPGVEADSGNGGDTSGTGKSTGVTNPSSSGGNGGNSGSCGFGCFSNSTGQGQTLTISPTQASLTVTNGVPQTQAFTVMLDGQDVTANVTWSFDHPDIGDVASANTFTPTGLVGGAGTLTASVGGKTITAPISVSISKVVNQANLPPSDQTAFDTPTTPESAMTMVYPLDGVVFPQDVLAPDVQYNGVGGGDVLRLKITEKYYSYVGYFSGSSNHFLMDDADWKSIEESGSGSQSDPLSIELERKSGATVMQPVKQTWHVAVGSLKGTIYYFELPNGSGNGRVLRIKPSAAAVDEFFTPGACWGCHTVSRDGKQIGAEFDDGDGPWGTINLTTTPPSYGYTPVGSPGSTPQPWTFSAFDDTGTRALVSYNDARQLNIVNPTNAAVLKTNALTGSCGEPAWSPDGKMIAGVCGMQSGSWTFDATNGDLTVANIDASNDVTNQHVAVAKGSANDRPAYPSFSPGSEWLAYTRTSAGSRSTGSGTLWMVKPDGTNAVPLTNATGPSNNSFNPVFAPLRAGGYYWIVYITRRNYGNQIVNQNLQQLWITAVDDPPGATDPSHPPFYLRGQEMSQKSENAYFALDPCKAIGDGCTSGVDCCNGQCVKDPNSSSYVCGTPTMGMCSENGNGCKVASDCCDPTALCTDGFCQVPVPQ